MRLRRAAEHVLGRAPYIRRGHVPYSIEQGRACPKCRCVQSRRFSPKGSRVRRLLTRWGEVALRWPRFVCECGGSITILHRALHVVQKYHSDAGVLAMIAREVDQTFPLPSERKYRSDFQPKVVH